jgi:uncharacterized damage-inducible protein DinB
MPHTLQEFLANAAEKAAADLETALKRLPEEKQNWSPVDTSRSALDQVAECAILNGTTAAIIQSRQFPHDFDFEAYARQKSELAQDRDAALKLLHENTPRAVDAIRAVADADLEVSVDMPWGPMTLAQIISYPYWNMSYHEGQINYIASMLGCLS